MPKDPTAAKRQQARRDRLKADGLLDFRARVTPDEHAELTRVYQKLLKKRQKQQKP